MVSLFGKHNLWQHHRLDPNTGMGGRLWAVNTNQCNNVAMQFYEITFIVDAIALTLASSLCQPWSELRRHTPLYCNWWNWWGTLVEFTCKMRSRRKFVPCNTDIRIIICHWFCLICSLLSGIFDGVDSEGAVISYFGANVSINIWRCHRYRKSHTRVAARQRRSEIGTFRLRDFPF